MYSTFSLNGPRTAPEITFPLSSMAEHSTVNRRVTGSSPVGGAAPAPSPASQAAGLRHGWGTGCWKAVCPTGALPASLSAKYREPVACSMSLRKFRVLDGSGNRGAAEGRRRFTQPRAAPVHPPAWGELRWRGPCSRSTDTIAETITVGPPRTDEHAVRRRILLGLCRIRGASLRITVIVLYLSEYRQ